MTDQRPAHLRTRQTGLSWWTDIITVTREPGGHRDDTGRWIPDAAETIVMNTSTAPANSEIIRRLEEGGERITGARTFWTSDRLQAGDIITWDARQWRVVVTDEWSDKLWAAHTVLRTSP